MPEFGLGLYQQPSGTDLRAGLLAIKPDVKAVERLES